MSIVIIIGLAFLVSYLSYNVAHIIISEYATYQEFLAYDLHKLDYLAIMLGSTDSRFFPFVDTSSYIILIPTFTFYIVGVLIASWRFIRLDHSYHGFLLARLATQKQFFSYLQQGVNKKIVIYTLSYTIISYALAQLLSPYPNEPLAIKMMLIILLFTVSRMVLLAALAQVVFIIYIKKEAIIAQFAILFIILMSLITGMNHAIINLVFYNPSYYFAPSFISAIFIIISTRQIKKTMTYQMIEKG